MKEKDIKIIIKGFTEQYGYLLEDIKGKESSSRLWTVSKDMQGAQYRLIFITEHSLNELTKYNILEDKINIYILFSENELNRDKESELLSINNLLGKPLIKVDIIERKVNYSENVKLEVVEQLAHVMSNNSLYSSREKTSLKNKSTITMGLIVINLMLYIVTAYLTSVYTDGSVFSSDTRVLILLGAKVNNLIAEGQYFRLITSMFLHGGIVHLTMNMYALYSIGPMVERVYGKKKYIIIYFISGICSSIFSYLFTVNVSVGASGAISGLLGAVLIFAMKSKGKTGNALIGNILSVIFVNIFIGITLPNIDNFAHLGGLLGGIIISFLLTLRTYN